MWTRCCLACWPKGYRNTCEESWGRRFRIGVRALRGLQEFLRVRERRRAGWPPPGERCSGSTSSERTADVSPAAGDAAGRRVVPRVSAPRGAQESGWPGAGCRCGAPRSCARCGRSRWRTSSAGCRAGSDSRLRALRRFLAALAGSKVVSGCPESRGAAWRASGSRASVAGCARRGGDPSLVDCAPGLEVPGVGQGSRCSRESGSSRCAGGPCACGLGLPRCPGRSGCPLA